jgi:hypothetical protein
MGVAELLDPSCVTGFDRRRAAGPGSLAETAAKVGMSKLFISHSSEDDGFVRDLQQALRNLGQDGWIDSRELRGGDPLWPEIQQAIEQASGYAVVVSPNSLQSKWVGKELRHALEVQK